jgi:predicted metal-dependent hydrolase
MFRLFRQIQRRAPKEIEKMHFHGREVVVVRKPYRRNLSLTLQVNGRIQLTVPKGAATLQLSRFLNNNRQWIDESLAKYAELRAHYPRKRHVDGERFPFLGRELIFKIRDEISNGEKPVVQRRRRGVPAFSIEGENLVYHPLENRPATGEMLAKFYEKCGREILSERLLYFSEKMNLSPSTVVFRSQKTRWGSCSTRGKISLNWRLVFAPMDVIDYVVVHELAHLRHHNHGASFWRLVAQHAPNYLTLRKWLRDHQYDADFLAKRSELHGD